MAVKLDFFFLKIYKIILSKFIYADIIDFSYHSFVTVKSYVTSCSLTYSLNRFNIQFFLVNRPSFLKMYLTLNFLSK